LTVSRRRKPGCPGVDDKADGDEEDEPEDDEGAANEEEVVEGAGESAGVERVAEVGKEKVLEEGGGDSSEAGWEGAAEKVDSAARIEPPDCSVAGDAAEEDGEDEGGSVIDVELEEADEEARVESDATGGSGVGAGRFIDPILRNFDEDTGLSGS